MTVRVRNAITGNTVAAIEALSALFASGVSADQIIKDAADFFRTLMLYKNGVKRTDILGSALSDIPEDIVSILSDEQIEAALKAFLNLYRDVRYSLSPRFEIELMILRLSALPSLSSPESLVRKLEEMKKGVAEGSVVVKVSKKAISIEEASPTAEKKKEEPLKPEPLVQATAEVVQPEPVEEVAEEEEPIEDSFSLTLQSLPAIAEALRKMGRATAARYLSSIEKIEENDGVYTLITSKPLAYNTLKNDEKNIGKAIASAFGESPVLKLRLEEKESGDALFSPQMKELKAFFGGNLIKKETDEKEKEENYVPKHESIRNDEDDGLSPEPDEDN